MAPSATVRLPPAPGMVLCAHLAGVRASVRFLLLKTYYRNSIRLIQTNCVSVLLHPDHFTHSYKTLSILLCSAILQTQQYRVI